MGGSDKFCRNCGNGLSQQPNPQQVSFVSQSSAIATHPQQPPFVSQNSETATEEDLDSPVVSQAFSETSRLSRAGVEKFLNSGEQILYATPNRIVSPTGDRFGYVTNKRVLLYIQVGHLIKRDRLEEWSLNHIRKLRMMEVGTLRKSLHLEIEDMKVKGGRQTLLDFYKSIQAHRA